MTATRELENTQSISSEWFIDRHNHFTDSSQA